MEFNDAWTQRNVNFIMVLLFICARAVGRSDSLSETTANNRIKFPFISADAFVSQTDKAALHNLQKMPLLPLVVRKFNEYAVDKIFYVKNSAESVRCGEKQFPTLYRLMQEAAEILHVPEPELYVKYDPTYNAYTAGVNRPFITIHSSLINSFTDDELLFVLGHEIGHIKCGHVLYQMMGRMLIPLLEAIGDMTLGLGKLAGVGLVAGFYEWMRQAEFSCDRAGLLVCQNDRTALSATMKLGCGSTRFNSEMDLDAFLEQARNHSEQAGLEGVAKALLFLMYTWQLDHPQVVFRAKWLDEWIASGAYQTILSGRYAQDMTGGSQMGEQVQCKNCKITVSATVRFCPSCGSDLQSNAPPNAVSNCKSCGSPMLAGARFCTECGTSA